MALEITTGVPCQIQAGDARAFQVQDSCHPASLWTGQIFFLRNGTPISNANSVANGNFHDFTLTAAQTNGLMGIQGQNVVQFLIRFTESANTANVETGFRGKTAIIPNLAVAQTKSQAATQLELVDAQLREMMASGQIYTSFSFNGQSATTFSRTELIRIRRDLQAEVNREKAALANLLGEEDGSTYQFRFRQG